MKSNVGIGNSCLGAGILAWLFECQLIWYQTFRHQEKMLTGSSSFKYRTLKSFKTITLLKKSLTLKTVMQLYLVIMSKAPQVVDSIHVFKSKKNFMYCSICISIFQHFFLVSKNLALNNWLPNSCAKTSAAKQIKCFFLEWRNIVSLVAHCSHKILQLQIIQSSLYGIIFKRKNIFKNSIFCMMVKAPKAVLWFER